jgi:hypothetical protein
MGLISDSIATLRNTTSFVNKIKQSAVVKPDNFKGFGGFVFDIVDSDGIRLESDITDHYIEDNTAINDHIALKPEIITVIGFSGELTSRISEAVNSLPPIPEKLQLITEYSSVLPIPLADAYLNVKSAIETATEAVQGVENMYNVFTNSNPEDKDTNQSKVFSYFYSMWQAREIFTVDTPFKTFTNVAIQNMEVTQGDSTGISEFSITFKKLRFTRTSFSINSQGRRVNQLAETVNKGNTRGEEKEQSLLRSISGFILGI